MPPPPALQELQQHLWPASTRADTSLAHSSASDSFRLKRRLLLASSQTLVQAQECKDIIEYRPVGFNIDGDDFAAFFQRAHANKLCTGKRTFLSQATVRAFQFLPRGMVRLQTSCRHRLPPWQPLLVQLTRSKQDLVNRGHSDQYLYRPGLELCRHDFYSSSAQLAFVRSLPHLAPGKGCEPGPGLYTPGGYTLGLRLILLGLGAFTVILRFAMWHGWGLRIWQYLGMPGASERFCSLCHISQACSSPAQTEGSKQAIRGIIIPDIRPKTQ